VKRMSRRGAVLLFALLVTAVYADPLFLRRNFGGRDLLGYHLPIEKAVHDAYQRGRLPVWISEVSGGRPLAANPNVGAFYPVRPLLSLFPFPLAMRIYPVVHWVLSGAGMILLLRLLGVSASGAWLGAATYVFSGVSLSEVFYTNNHPGVMLLPWIVWSVARPTALTRRVLVCSILLGLDFLAGDLFTIAIALAAAALWIALETEPQRRFVGWCALAASVVLGALLALPQIAAAALWAPHTERAVSGLRLGDALELSISPLRLIEFLIPFPFGATWSLSPRSVWGTAALSGRASGFFSSLYAGALPVIALIATRRSSARGVRMSQALIALGLTVAVPGSFLPEAWKGWSAPLPLRHPEKCAVAILLGLAVLAAWGWDCLRERGRIPTWTVLVGGGLAVLAAAAWLFPLALGRAAAGIAGRGDADAATAATLLAGSIAEGGLLWMMAVVALGLSSRRRIGRAISLILLTAIPIAANRKIAHTFREEEVFEPTAFARTVARADPQSSYRTLAIPSSPTPDAAWAGSDTGRLDYLRRSWLYFTPVLWGRGAVFNQDADLGDLSRATSLRRIATLAAGFTDSSAFFGDLALRWEIRFRGEPARAGYHRIGGDLLQDWDEHERAFPDMRLLTRWREARDAVSALRAVPRLDTGEIVIETGGAGAGASVDGRMRVLEKTPERVRLDMDAPAPTWLFLLRGYFPYREALLDGHPVDVAPAQLAFSAIRVPAGRHLLDWRERLPGAKASAWGPILFFLAAAALLARGARERRVA
jgi:hypothetical protein